MINDESIERSNHLTLLAQDFLQYKTEYQKNSEQFHSLNSKIAFLKYFKASEKDWSDWQWQLKNRITNIRELCELFEISQRQIDEIKKVEESYRWAVTPYYLSLIRKFDNTDPIFLQSIPSINELNCDGKLDPMNEVNNNPAGVITRRYPDRVTMNITNCCPSFCRHCQRRRNIGNVDKLVTQKLLNDSYEFLKLHPEIRDVLITGGDPLTLEDDFIENIIKDLRDIKTVEIIRIGTRTPVTLPQRITESLIVRLKKYDPIFINTQFNHPNEITEESIKACHLITDNGILLGNQMVFLKNINNNYFSLQLLNQMLSINKVRPYYIFHPKDVIGTQHFSIPLSEGIEIYEKLRGNTSGMTIPTYVLNTENGLGKIPLSHDLLNFVSKDKIVTLKTWEGKSLEYNIGENK